MDPVVPSCSLTPDGLEAQRARQARLAPSVRSVKKRGRSPFSRRLEVEFAAGFDREALAELIAVERQCCPFFTFDFDERRRALSVGVSDAEHEPALGALAELLAHPAG